MMDAPLMEIPQISPSWLKMRPVTIMVITYKDNCNPPAFKLSGWIRICTSAWPRERVKVTVRIPSLSFQTTSNRLDCQPSRRSTTEMMSLRPLSWMTCRATIICITVHPVHRYHLASTEWLPAWSLGPVARALRWMTRGCLDLFAGSGWIMLLSLLQRKATEIILVRGSWHPSIFMTGLELTGRTLIPGCASWLGVGGNEIKTWLQSPETPYSGLLTCRTGNSWSFQISFLQDIF